MWLSEQYFEEQGSILPENSYLEKILNLKMTELALLVAFMSVATFCLLRKEQDR